MSRRRRASSRSRRRTTTRRRPTTRRRRSPAHYLSPAVFSAMGLSASLSPVFEFPPLSPTPLAPFVPNAGVGVAGSASADIARFRAAANKVMQAKAATLSMQPAVMEIQEIQQASGAGIARLRAAANKNMQVKAATLSMQPAVVQIQQATATDAAAMSAAMVAFAKPILMNAFGRSALAGGQTDGEQEALRATLDKVETLFAAKAKNKSNIARFLGVLNRMVQTFGEIVSFILALGVIFFVSIYYPLLGLGVGLPVMAGLYLKLAATLTAIYMDVSYSIANMIASVIYYIVLPAVGTVAGAVIAGEALSNVVVLVWQYLPTVL